MVSFFAYIELAVIWLDSPGEQLDQSGFSSSILAHQHHNFAVIEASFLHHQLERRASGECHRWVFVLLPVGFFVCLLRFLLFLFLEFFLLFRFLLFLIYFFLFWFLFFFFLAISFVSRVCSVSHSEIQTIISEPHVFSRNEPTQENIDPFPHP